MRTGVRGAFEPLFEALVAPSTTGSRAAGMVPRARHAGVGRVPAATPVGGV
ncbi:MAG: hypothetical protein ACRDWE_11765 [Acidimicrobiales bacterium]